MCKLLFEFEWFETENYGIYFKFTIYTVFTCMLSGNLQKKKKKTRDEFIKYEMKTITKTTITTK